MNDELEGVQVGGTGSQVQPDAVDSSDKDADTSSTQSSAASLLKEILPSLTEETQKIVREELKKQTQRVKDKRIHDHEDRIGSLEDTTRRLEKHLKAGKTLDEAKDLVKTEVRQEQFFQEFESLKDRVEELPSGTGQPSLVEREATILKSLGLDAQDPRVIKIQKESSDADDYIKKLEENWWNLKARPTGGVDEISTGGGGAPPTKVSQDELMAKYQAELESLRTGPYVGDARKINEIRNKYIQLGLKGI
jgi:hypothetical protein